MEVLSHLAETLLMLVLGLADHLRRFRIHDVRCAEFSYQPFCFSQCHQCCVSSFVREVQAIADLWISSHQSSLSFLCSSSFIAAAKNLMAQIQASNVKMIHATAFSMLLFPFLYKNSGLAAKRIYGSAGYIFCYSGSSSSPRSKGSSPSSSSSSSKV